jgi:hypothetical protein
MKRLAAVVALAVTAVAAHAGMRTDYVQEWPLRLSRADGGAFRVELTSAIYESAQDSSLADIEVFNAAGDAVPSALFAPDQPLARAERAPRVAIDFFALPSRPADSTAGGVEFHAERGADGRVSRVDVSVVDPAAPPTPRNDVLLDLSQLREPVVAIELDWRATESPLDVAYAIETSHDLRTWSSTALRGGIVDLRNAGGQLRRDRIELGGLTAPYVRLVANPADGAPEITSVTAELRAATTEPAWSWQPLPARRVEENGHVHFDFTLPARIPVQRVDVTPGANNTAIEWTLSSRESDKATWQMRAGPWMGYQVDAGGGVERSATQPIFAPTRDRLWRLDAATAVASAPTLRLGYRAEVLVFLAQGDGPFTLAAGSAKARRGDAPIARLVAELRGRRGSDWQPLPAYVDTARVVSGPAALQPATPVRTIDWKSWLLWAVLAGGALIVTAMALQLLRRPAGDDPSR